MTTATNAQSGKITQVIGPVVDVEFPPGALPDIYTALRVTNPAIDARAGQPRHRGRRSTSARTPPAASRWTRPTASSAACR